MSDTNGTAETTQHTPLGMWLSANPLAQLAMILDCAPEDWYAEHALPVLARYLDDAQQWGRIEARWRALFQSPVTLRRALEAWRRDHPEAAEPAIDARASARQPDTLEARLQRLYASADPDVWYAGLEALAEIRRNAVKWGYAKEKARQRGINAYGLEKAVDEVVTARQREAERANASAVESAPLEAQSQEAVLRLLTEEWGVPIVECIRHGTENATWHLKLEGGREISLGPSKHLLNEAAVRAAIFDATGKVIKHYGKPQQDRWRELVEMVAAIAVTVDTEEITAMGQAHALILGYLGREQLTLDCDTEKWEEQASGNKPFLRGGAVHIHARDMWNAYARIMMPDIEPRQVIEYLRLIGGYSDKVTLNNHRTSRTYWKISLNTILTMQRPTIAEEVGDEVFT